MDIGIKLMSLSENWRRIIIALVILASATGIYYINQTDEPSVKLTRIDEIKLNSFDVVEDVYVYNNEIYVTGWKYDNKTHPMSNACLIKLDNEGNILWEKTWMKNRGTYARKLSCTKDGVYIVIETKDESPLTYKTLVKYDLEGELQWSINATNISEIATDNECIFTIVNGFLIKLDGSGEIIWNRTVTGASIFINANIVYVGGSTTEDATGGSDAIVTAFDMEGNQLWSTRRASTRGDQIRDICATDEGIFIVGSGTKGWDFFFITKFSSSGEQVWDKKLVKTVNGTFSSLFSANGVLFAVGALGDSPRDFDALTSIINSDGSIAASDAYDESGDEDYAYGVYACEGGIYVVGTSASNPPPTRHGILLIYNYR